MSPSSSVSHRRAALVLLVTLLAGCAGAPPRYYTLAAVPPDAAPAAADATTAAATAARIVVGPVNLPDYLDRRPIVTRDTAYEIRLASNDYWAGPLQDMVPRVLVADLAARLPGDRIESFPELHGDYRVVVDIDRFDVDTAGLAILASRWRIYGKAAPQALLAGDATLHQQAGASDYPAATAALSAALGELADAIARTVKSLRSEGPRSIGSS